MVSIVIYVQGMERLYCVIFDSSNIDIATQVSKPIYCATPIECFLKLTMGQLFLDWEKISRTF
jgi:hypothetical protein